MTSEDHDRAAPWMDQGLRLPGLAVILVGDDPASEVYVKGKRRDCDEVGFHSIVQHVSANVTQDDLEDRIVALNNDATTTSKHSEEKH